MERGGREESPPKAAVWRWVVEYVWSQEAVQALTRSGEEEGGRPRWRTGEGRVKGVEVRRVSLEVKVWTVTVRVEEWRARRDQPPEGLPGSAASATADTIPSLAMDLLALDLWRIDARGGSRPRSRRRREELCLNVTIRASGLVGWNAADCSFCRAK